MYSVFTKLRDGEFLLIDYRDDCRQAVQLVEELNANWPHKYVVRDSMGNEVDLNIQPPSRRT
jgi:hypothetical protein